ncbi:MAG: YidC/Oxa1 family membrane protein insertase [Actinomycetota bacterium]
MFDLIAQVLAFFYSLVPSYGVAIILLTLAVMIVVTPLTLKSTRSMLQMQRLQPELKAIQTRYKDDRQKMNEELMAFYQENGINPLGGCLPLLVQLPVFLVLFRVVQGITRHATDVGLAMGWAAGRGSDEANTAVGLDDDDLVFDPENLPVDSEMYADLVQTTEMNFLGMDLSKTALDVAGSNIIDALPYFVLIVVVLVSSLYQQRQIRGRNTGAPVNPQQEMIMRILPWMLPVFSLTMPAALVVYFVISNLYRIGQQAYITRSLYKGEDSLGAQAARSREEARKGDGGGGNRKGSGGRTTEKKGQATPKRTDARSSSSKGGQKKGGNAKSKGSGAGRTGKAPTRQRSGGGRTTEPGSPQHKKRKR